MTSPKVAICSLFRDNVDDVDRAFLNRGKWQYDRKDVIHICVEGDSVDGTYDALKKVNGFKTIIHKYDTGSPKFGSVIEPERLKNLAASWNIALDAAVAENAHYAVILDSDITTPPNFINRLISHDKDIVAPMLYFENSVWFRDTWAYHADGEDFINRPPYHKWHKNNRLFEVDGVGIPFMKHSVLKSGVRCDGMEVRGLCKAAKANGFKIFVDPNLSTYHPRGGIVVPDKYNKR